MSELAMYEMIIDWLIDRLSDSNLFDVYEWDKASRNIEDEWFCLIKKGWLQTIITAARFHATNHTDLE